MCPESIPTVSIVNRCPSNATEWVSAAKRKSCKDLGQLQSCTTADDFVYHCVLNKDATMLLEVCAPTYLMSGYCARFSEVEKRIIIDTGLDCTKFDPPCSSSFSSNESFKYQTCYRNAGEILEGCEVSRERNLHFTKPIVISVIFAIIILLILIITGVGCKLKMIKFANRKKSSKQNKRKEINDREMEDTEPLNEPRTEANMNIATPQPGGGQENYVQQENLRSLEEKKTMCYRSLSGEIIGDISLKGLKTISDVREMLAVKLDVSRDTLYVVNVDHGVLWEDNKEMRDLSADTLSLMIVLDENRMKQTNDGRSKGDTDDDSEDNDDDDDDDDLDNNHEEYEELSTVYSKCKHKGSWFCWTRHQLLEMRFCSVKCQECLSTLKFDEIVKRCNMTPDEQIFFQTVLSLNKHSQLRTAQLEISGSWLC